jgi:hypothetical protein
MEKQITVKNTKNEIIKAYEELLQKVKEKKNEDPKVVQQSKVEKETVTKANSLSSDGIVKDISSLKMNLGTSLDKLEEKLVNEYKILENLQQAIAVEKKNLEELYQISANADSLSALILGQKEKKEAFELEIEVSKEKWTKEQQQYTEQNKDSKEKLDKERKREEEEYNYTRLLYFWSRSGSTRNI